MAYFVVLGNPVLHEKHFRARASKSLDWTINPKASVGDRAMIYLTAPVSAFVATAEVATTPELIPKGKPYAGMHWATLRRIRLLKPYVLRKDVMEQIPEWGYMQQPHPSRQVPEKHLPAILKMLGSTAVPRPREELAEAATATGPRRQPDPLQRKRIEEIAIGVTWEHFGEKGMGYKMDSVEADNVGWDLTAVRKGADLKLEVKGLSGEQIVVDLTPNEYAAMKNHRTSYRLCVVSNAIVKPKLHVFSYSSESGGWETDDGRILNLKELTGVRCSAANL